MTNLELFLERLYIPDTDIQVGTHNTCDWKYGDKEDIQSYLNKNTKKDLYFLANMEKGSPDRSPDDCFSKKKYFGIDFDIRKDSKVPVSDDEIIGIGSDIAEKFNQYELTQDWSYLIFTGNGVHFFFIGDIISIDNDKYENAIRYLHQEMQKICGHKPDSSCVNLGRIFRLPTSFNQQKKKKGNGQPDHPNQSQFIVIRNKTCNTLGRFDELANLYEEPIKKRFDNAAPLIPQVQSVSGDFWDEAFNLNPLACLQELSGKPEVNCQIFTFPSRGRKGGYYIYVDGCPANAWIDESGRIAVPRNANYQGCPSIVQWLGHPDYGHDWKSIYKTIKNYFRKWMSKEAFMYKDNSPLPEYCGEAERYADYDVCEPAAYHQIVTEIRPKASEISLIKPVTNRTAKSGIKWFTWGASVLDESFSTLESDGFGIVVGEKGRGKTTYTFDMACKNAKLGHKVAYVQLDMNPGRMVESITRRYAGITIREKLRDRQDLEKINPIKLEAQSRKEKEINDMTNLSIIELPRGEKRTWENIEKIIHDIRPEGFDMIFIDHWKRIATKGDSYAAEEQKISDILSYITRTNTLILVLHHFRKSKHSFSMFREMDDMDGIGSLPGLADYVVQIQRTTPPQPKKDGEDVPDDRTDEERKRLYVYLQKGRDGDDVIGQVYFNAGTFDSEYEPPTWSKPRPPYGASDEDSWRDEDYQSTLV